MPWAAPGPPSGAVAYPLVFTNADPGAAHGIVANTLNYAVTSNQAGCEAYVSLETGTGSTFGTLKASGVPSIAAGGTNTTAGAGVKIHADGNAPAVCAGKTFTLTFSGTSN